MSLRGFLTSTSCSSQVRAFTIITTRFPSTMRPVSSAASLTLPPASSTSCASWVWLRTARECPERWWCLGYSAPETEATAVAKTVGKLSASRQDSRRVQQTSGNDIFHHPLSLSQLHEGLDHILLVLCGVCCYIYTSYSRYKR